MVFRLIKILIFKIKIKFKKWNCTIVILNQTEWDDLFGGVLPRKTLA